MRAATTLWATSQWRRRWVALAITAFVPALTGALALGAAMGARRSVTAFDRLREQAFATDVKAIALTFSTRLRHQQVAHILRAD